MSIGFVIGNGSSRRNFDIRKLYTAGITYGCNAVHRDFMVQHLVCVERKHLAEAMSWKLQDKIYLHTSHKNINLAKDPKLELLPEVPYEKVHFWDDITSFEAGPAALLLAAQSHDIVIIFGFDFGQNEHMYSDTDNYTSLSRTYDCHLHQVKRVISHYKESKFIFVNNIADVPETLSKLDNVLIDTYENLEIQLLT